MIVKKYKAPTEKEAVLAEYEEQLTEEVISAYREKLSDYTVVDLDKELAYELKKNNPSVFTKKTDNGYVPKDQQKDPLDEILSKYKK